MCVNMWVYAYVMYVCCRMAVVCVVATLSSLAWTPFLLIGADQASALLLRPYYCSLDPACHRRGASGPCSGPLSRQMWATGLLCHSTYLTSAGVQVDGDAVWGQGRIYPSYRHSLGVNMCHQQHSSDGLLLDC